MISWIPEIVERNVELCAIKILSFLCAVSQLSMSHMSNEPCPLSGMLVCMNGILCRCAFTGQANTIWRTDLCRRRGVMISHQPHKG